MRAIMTFLAQERRTGFQQRSDIGTVRNMTASAIFGRGLMFKQERPASFGMALEASFVNRIFLEQHGASRTVRIMTTRANDLAFLDRMVGNTTELGTLIFVAGETDFRLISLAQSSLLRPVNIVAIGASYAVDLVRAAFPVGAGCLAIVASHALLGAFRSRVRGSLGIFYIWRIGRALKMACAHTVA